MRELTKTIFKAIGLAILVPYIIMFVVEIVNINISSIELKNYMRQAAYQATVLSSQESYRYSDGRIVKMNDIYDETGNTYISGDFYLNNSSEGIWKQIYESTDFINFCNNTSTRDTGESVKDELSAVRYLYKYMHEGEPVIPAYDSDDDTIRRYNEWKQGQAFYKNMITMNNVGVTYIPVDIVNRMFKWNLGELMGTIDLNRGTEARANIRIDENGFKYIDFKGFRVYASEAVIDEVEYRIFDLNDPAECIEMEGLVNVSSDVIKEFLMSANARTSLDGTSISKVSEDNAKVIIAGIYYSVPVSYEGITPFKRLFNYIWNYQVEGINTDTSTLEYQQFGDNTLTGLGKGATVDDSVGGYNRGIALPSGRLFYTVIQ